jgi:hypothetical protein
MKPAVGLFPPPGVYPPMTDQLKRPLELIGTSILSQQDFLRQLTTMQASSNDKTSKSFKKIPPKYQNMILVASSTGQVTETEPNVLAAQFFKSSSLLNANIMLNSLFETEQLDCSVSNAVTNAFMRGSFLWTNAVTPSGLAASVITTEDLLRKTDALYEGMLLDISTRHDVSSLLLDKLTKTQILFPSSTDEAIDRIQALKILVAFFFGERSFAAQGLKRLYIKCLDNKSLLKVKQSLDKEFNAKLLCCIDERLYQWLKECCNTDCVMDTSLDLINFAVIFTDIQLNRFHFILFQNIRKVKKDRDDREEREEQGGHKKKKQKKVQMMKNEHQVKEWKLRIGEKWDNIFRSKTQEGPILSIGTKPCLKFHCKGICYDDCRWKAAHIELNENDHKLTAQFIKELRGE